VGAAAAGLRRLGIRRGDRVVGFVGNTPESVIAFLATASVGAIWSSCAPEFGIRSVVERFRQIEPALLFAVDGYRYGGAAYDRLPAVEEIQRNLPTVKATVLIPQLQVDAGRVRGVTSWSELLSQASEVRYEPVPFDHPLWVLYSSGTTGLPKAIVQGHGGILLEHLKSLSLHMDLTPEDRFFWFTTTSWMMWNLLIGGLLVGSTVVLYDGSPAVPDAVALWRFAEESQMTYFGTSASYIQACIKAGIEPGRDFDLHRLRGVGSTGSPLSPEGFRWVYQHVSPDVLLGSASGGTDVCTAFVGACPLLPVVEGEIQCRMLGAAVDAFDPQGRPLVDEVGELVLTQPMPSMPLYFWNDPQGQRYRASYFEAFPGVWCHGDWIKITPRGSCVIYGRSDSTLNRGGVRMGSAEFYRVVEDFPEVVDSLVVDTGQLDLEGRLLLFVALRPGETLDAALQARIGERLRRDLSPRHVPDQIYQIPEIPRTLTGKKLEVPVKRILNGTAPEIAVSRDAMTNPDSMAFFVRLASKTAQERR
jgi:acetoacetyl-CoA synthetase